MKTQKQPLDVISAQMENGLRRFVASDATKQIANNLYTQHRSELSKEKMDVIVSVMISFNDMTTITMDEVRIIESLGAKYGIA